MPKRKIPGISKSSGMKTGFPLFPSGKYVFEVTKYSYKESDKGLATIHNFIFLCKENMTGSDEMLDKMYGHRLVEMHEDHPSYEEWSHLFVDEAKSFCDAAGVQIGKGDTVDLEDLVGTSIVATVAQKDAKDAEGKPTVQNVIRKYESAS